MSFILLIAYAMQLYQWLLIGRIILSWFPDFSDHLLARALIAITEPYLALFRGWIPLVGGTLDISPMLAIFIISWLQQALVLYFPMLAIFIISWLRQALVLYF